MAHTLGTPVSRERLNFVNVALVGALHIGAIYTFLVALDVVPNPVLPPGPVTLTVLDQQPAKPIPPSGPGINPTLRHPVAPVAPVAPVPPIFQMKETSGASTWPPSGNGSTTTTTPPTGVTSPVRSVTATHTIPPYPPLAIRLGYSGSVQLRIDVDDRGNVVGAGVQTSSGHSDLDAVAVAWVKAHWRYEPAMQDGHAVDAHTTAVVTFRLNQAD